MRDVFRKKIYCVALVDNGYFRIIRCLKGILSFPATVLHWLRGKLCRTLGIIKGPGTVSIDGGVSASIDGFGITISYGTSFPVPSGKYGNIVAGSAFKVTKYRTMHRHKDGKTSSGGTYIKKVPIGSGWWQLRTR